MPLLTNAKKCLWPITHTSWQRVHQWTHVLQIRQQPVLLLPLLLWHHLKYHRHNLIVCPMHGQNINLPVSVSVTLSVDSPTGQTPQRIFTVNSLKDAFWGSRWWIITFRGTKSPKPPFWGLNRHFKPNMRKIQIVTSSDLCMRLTWNLTILHSRSFCSGWTSHDQKWKSCIGQTQSSTERISCYYYYYIEKLHTVCLKLYKPKL